MYTRVLPALSVLAIATMAAASPATAEYGKPADYKPAPTADYKPSEYKPSEYTPEYKHDDYKPEYKAERKEEYKKEQYKRDEYKSDRVDFRMDEYKNEKVKNQCNTGPVHCCDTIEDASSENVSKYSGLLGDALSVQGANVPVGLNCSPAAGGSGANCAAQPACCDHVESSERRAILTARRLQKANWDNSETKLGSLQISAAVLSRVSEILARCGFNIDSLVICRTKIHDLIRMSIVLGGQNGVVEQARRQLGDLVPVWAMLDHTGARTIVRELLLVKVSIINPEYLEEQVLADLRTSRVVAAQ
ncbi:hypothetical protein EW146_g7870 [Bondarzewia mesenterica]|uniref:Acetolactate synthase small subunit-like ACT domain-containing protein n=1 Tax=Bondarzewia mesenterica TaxID=1095465 RepID=A0A4S4LIU0_9AGAM|nr:hypothetical protein EW146_g7870 [Bondarzewia mesenterica]